MKKEIKKIKKEESNEFKNYTQEEYINKKQQLELERMKWQAEARRKEAENYYFLNKKFDELYKYSLNIDVFNQKDLEYYQKSIKKFLKCKKTRKIHLEIEVYYL